MNQITFAVLTISDTCYQDASRDRSGPRLVQLIRDAFENAQITTEILPDECELIKQSLLLLLDKCNPSVIFTTGGTGFAPRDITPEATKSMLDKECPQLAMAIALASLQKTKYAALSRGVCGIARKTLIMNLPGSEKACVECFEVVCDLLPHALHLLNDQHNLIKRTHAELQEDGTSIGIAPARHVCPHITASGDGNDRNSPFDMIPVSRALEMILKTVQRRYNISQLLADTLSPVDIPPFRASIKDGYAMKSSGFSGTKKVVGYIAAGDEVNIRSLQEDECFKINTGAAVPHYADCVIQVEDTKLLKSKPNGEEDLVAILVDPKPELDIRPIGSDLGKGSKLFPSPDHSSVVINSIFASIGREFHFVKPEIAIISTGSELLSPGENEVAGKIYDSNSTMLEELLIYFGFECSRKLVLTDDFETVKNNVSSLFETVDFVICSGGVSMGDKDYIKPVLEKLGFKIHFGRVNMKPGKPMTFASKDQKYFFGLPGNPVSAFVTFHLFALPAIRWAAGGKREKIVLPTVSVTLENDITLDPRPEYVRASITCKNGGLYASVNGNQMSSRLQSIVGADVLVHLPGHTSRKSCAVAGDMFKASVLRYDFISKYE